MNTSLVETIKSGELLYHTKSTPLPHFYSFEYKIAEKYGNESNKQVSMYQLKRDIHVINMSNPLFIDDLLYQIYLSNWYYSDIEKVYNILVPFGLLNDTQIAEFYKDRGYNVPTNINMCDYIMRSKDHSEQFSWLIAKNMIESRRFVQRMSIDRLDKKLFQLLAELYQEFNIDGFNVRLFHPSIIVCGLHHPELYIIDPAKNISLFMTAGGMELNIKSFIPPEIDALSEDRLKEMIDYMGGI